jgi:hypothetical protein
MNFLKRFTKIFQRPYIGIAALVLFFSLAGVVAAQFSPTNPIPDVDVPVITIDPPVVVDPGGNPVNLGDGTVLGWAWMGTGITNQNAPEGGGGWLKFNCEPDMCTHSSWGVRVNPDETSPQHGYFSGEAWSNNYGWMTFDPAVVSKCWQANPGETANDVAHILFPSGKIVGWAKFVNGDDFNNDDYTGCVSFSGIDYSASVDFTTGAIEGWAWGSNVIGWISFQNPECPFCDPTIVLDDVVDITFWADSYSVPAGGGTTLHWAAQNTPAASVISCPNYGNTNNYNHWRSSFFNISPANVGTINVSQGNLPTGMHPISGINSTTTYDLTCKDSNGNTLPTKYLTITTVRPIIGCMDRTATNYNPLANSPGRCTYGPASGPAVDLQMVTNFPPNYLPVDSAVPFNYQVSPRWTFTNPTQVGTPYCHGKFFDQNGVEQNLQAWSGADLDRPGATSLPPWFAGPYSTTNNVAAFAPGVPAGSQFTYEIDCTDINGNTFSDTATVVFRRIRPVAGCTDPAATNFNPAATVDNGSCTYGPVSGCTDSTAINYNPLATVDDGSCDDGSGGGGRPTLNLQVTPDVFVLGNTPYEVGPISWTGTNLSQIAPNSCIGKVTKNNDTILFSLPGWTGNQNNPNSSIAVPPYLDLTSQMNGATTSTNFKFTITCQTTSGSSISDSDMILVTAPAVEPPILWLHIVDPNISEGPQGPTPSSASLLRETIAATGEDDFVLNWQAANVVSGSCEKASEKYGGAPNYSPLGANTSWPNGATLPLSSQGYGGQTLDISGVDIKNTKFQIECEPLNAPGTTITAQVCMGVDGQSFPQCAAGSSTNRPPGYKEI